VRWSVPRISTGTGMKFDLQRGTEYVSYEGAIVGMQNPGEWRRWV
jgi:hypothetical protein